MYSVHISFFSVLNSAPLLKDLFRVITPDYADHWKTIGDLLNVPTTLLEATETTNPMNQQWCCNDMLKIWLASNTSATWKDILEAIDSLTITQGVSSAEVVQQSGPVNGVCVVYQLYSIIVTIHFARFMLWSP